MWNEIKNFLDNERKIKNWFIILLSLIYLSTIIFNFFNAPKDVDVIFIKDMEFTRINSSNGNTTHEIRSDFKNVGAPGTVIIKVKCYDENRDRTLYSDIDLFDLTTNQRGNMSRIIERPTEQIFNCSFQIMGTFEDYQEYKLISSKIPFDS